MKKYFHHHIIGLFLLLCLSATTLLSQPVSQREAEQVALNFMRQRAEGQQKQRITSVIDTYAEVDGSDTLYFVFNLEPEGYVFVSADKVAFPIIGYSYKGFYESELANPTFLSFMDPIGKELKAAKRTKSNKDNPNPAYWQAFLQEPNGGAAQEKSTNITVGPLLSTTWDQEMFYNDWCPMDANGSRVPVGCAATAMGQVMKYYQYPNFGSGSNSYWHNTYGTQSANFNTHYNYSEMPAALFSANAQVAKLLYHCGVAVNTDYDPTGSGAFHNDIRYALDEYFGYDSPELIWRNNIYYVFNPDAWGNTIKNEINTGRPVLYTGQSTGAHIWVCDGYESFPQYIPGTGFYQTVTHFHMNWGWGGRENGYFFLHQLTPDSSNFNDHQSAIIHLIPENCHYSYSYTNPSLAPSSIETEYQITASATITPLFGLPIPVMFDAGTYVQLNPGTVINAGTVFTARIEGCKNGGDANLTGEEEDVEERGQQETTQEETPPAITTFAVAPNPSAGHTTVSFSTLSEAPFRLELYDITGRKLRNLLDDPLAGSGEHQVSFDASTLTAGLYLICLQADNTAQTIKWVRNE
jgi:hypothetical protein